MDAVSGCSTHIRSRWKSYPLGSLAFLGIAALGPISLRANREEQHDDDGDTREEAGEEAPQERAVTFAASDRHGERQEDDP